MLLKKMKKNTNPLTIEEIKEYTKWFSIFIEVFKECLINEKDIS